MQSSAATERSGILFAVAAYVAWGLLPGFFLLLEPAGPIEIVAWRVLFSLVFCVVAITIVRGWPALVAIVRQPRLLFTMGLAGALIFVNWTVFVVAAVTGHVLEAALGYFINPIVTVLIGVIVLRERLRALQWVAVGISALAVLVIAVNYGVFPWISLVLAFSFGLYGLVKKRVGPSVDAFSGLAIETAWLAPLAAGMLVYLALTTGVTFGAAGTVHALLLISSGIVTALPLVLFAAGSRRLPLVYMGLIQYLNPVMQFIFGVFILRESMPPTRWLGFGLVWLALVVLSIDLINRGRASRRVVPELI